MRKTALSLIALLATSLTPLGMTASAQTTAPAPATAMTNKDWWPQSLDVSALRQHDASVNPYGADFDYAAQFKKLDIVAVKADIVKVLTSSQSWWPADYGNYGPFFIRMAWHSAGTYRTIDGRGGSSGGQQRFEPLNSWPDNTNLDKARRLLWPIKAKYGRSLSWGDLIVLTGNVALENMGFKTLGYAGGRTDDWQPDVVYWGMEHDWNGSARFDANHQLKGPVAASQLGLIYVNPQGPNGNPDPIAAAADIRQTFGRMAMNDEEIVALIAGGHTFGKSHGAHPGDCLGAAPAAGAVEQQGMGWANKCGKGSGGDAVTSGLEGAWSANPIAFTTQYLDNLFTFDWVLTKSPAGAYQWTPKDPAANNLVPDAHDATKRHPPMMFTTDLSMKEDPAFRVIALRFRDHPEQFADAFAHAWFKLTHRDMGPKARYVGSEVPAQDFSWQDPLPKASYAMIESGDVVALKGKLLASGLSNDQLLRTAWAAASTFRGTDFRGGVNGARIRLAPEKGWAVNDPVELDKALAALTKVEGNFNKSASGGKKVSLADLIVIGGNVAVEQAAAKAGVALTLPFTPGRVDASIEQTDAKSFAVLEPQADGFRDYYSKDFYLAPAQAMIDKANMLDLNVQEMTVLWAGMRALDANTGHSRNGVFTAHPGTLSNEVVTNLLDMGTVWTKSAKDDGLYEGRDRASGELKWTATPVDLIFGSSSELRAVAEVYASQDGREQFVRDFAKAWTKVMNLDRM